MCEWISYTIKYINDNMGVTTLIAGTITALSTFSAVFITSWLDRRERKFASNKELYREKSLELLNAMKYLKAANNMFFDINCNCKFEILPDASFPYWKKLREIYNILGFISTISPKSIFAEFYKNQMPFFLALNSFWSSHCVKTIISADEFIPKMKEYIEDRNSRDEDEPEFENIDYTNKIKKIEEMENQIKDEFKIG